MVSSIAIPNIIGVIIAVETSKGMSNRLITIARIAKGKILGMSTNNVVLNLLINIKRHKKATKNAAKNDLNCVSKIKWFSWEKTTAKPLIFS